jgi:hypothetical protein
MRATWLRALGFCVLASCSSAPGGGTGGTSVGAGSTAGAGASSTGSSGGSATSSTGGSSSGTAASGTGAGTGGLGSSGGSGSTSGGGSSGGCPQGNCPYANCDEAPLGAACAGNAGSQNPGETCVDGACVVPSCGGAVGTWSCALPADGGIGACCGSACVDFEGADNCGGCGVMCVPGAACSGELCSAVCQSGDCPNGFSCAALPGTGNVCLTTSCASTSDGTNCVNAAGAAGLCCSQACVDDTTAANCGACGNACASGACLEGFCETANCAGLPDDYPCAQGGTQGFCCLQGCTYPETDPANCGGCGNVCGPGQVCNQGECQTPVSCSVAGPGELCVGGNGQVGSCCGGGCADLGSDADNCGDCGVACAVGSTCTGGLCIAPDGGAAICGDGVACPPGSACAQGTCLPQACSPSIELEACAFGDGGQGTCCSAACANVQSDPVNCGGCGELCPPGTACAAGICAAPDGGSFTCLANPASCPAGTFCVSSGACLSPSCPAGASGVACVFGISYLFGSSTIKEGTCCGGNCVDPEQDPANCGQCGIACPSGVCYDYVDQQPNILQCFPTADAGSSVSCTEETVGALCAVTDGGIGIGVCCFGYPDPICADLAADPENCGDCRVACPGGQSCIDGVCSGAVAPCGAGRDLAYCNLDAGPSWVCCTGGGCADLESDPANCGSCGDACAQGFSCLSGSCLATSCATVAAGSACPAADGTVGQCCESACSDVSSDPQNCGACGVSCAGGESCRQESCALDQCSASAQGDPCHLDAGSTLTVGSCCSSSCVDISDDPVNCGGCGLVCGDDGGCNQSRCS